MNKNIKFVGLFLVLAIFSVAYSFARHTRPAAILAAPVLKYYAVDRISALSDYSRLAGWGINAAVVDIATCWKMSATL